MDGEHIDYGDDRKIRPRTEREAWLLYAFSYSVCCDAVFPGLYRLWLVNLPYRL